MSVDIYVAVPAGEWPTAAAVEQCASRQGYPVKVGRFPSLDTRKVVTDGATVSLDGRDIYLEGSLSPASLSGEEVRAINDRLSVSASPFRINDEHVLMSVHSRSIDEMRAASYVIASLVICFSGYGFEPQGNAHGRQEFAKSFVDGAALLREP